MMVFTVVFCKCVSWMLGDKKQAFHFCLLVTKRMTHFTFDGFSSCCFYEFDNEGNDALGFWHFGGGHGNIMKSMISKN